MQKDITGSILLGFGTLSTVMVGWADTAAYSVPLPVKILAWAIPIAGLGLIGVALKEEIS